MNPHQLETCLQGIALGDSLGLPMEGLRARRSAKLFPGPVRQRMFAGKGLLSDDTLMAVATVQALYLSPDDPDLFASELARRLKWWFWCLPPGIGLATLKSCMRLTVGISATRSGIASAGNGPAVRAVVLGCALSSDPIKRVQYITASTRITHTHSLADSGSQLAGLAAALATTGDFASFRPRAEALTPSWPWSTGYPQSGPTGFIVHTMNAAMECLEKHPKDLAAGLQNAITLGGDTDSVAAIVGGIIGAGLQEDKVPRNWKSWIGWPQPLEFEQIATGSQTHLPVTRLLAQHAISLGLVVPHIARRALPPY